MEDAHGSSATVQQDVGGGLPTIDVNNANDLINALKPENAGRTIRLLSPEHKVDKTLVVPDGATLQGAGVMLFDDQGLPVKFKQGTTTTITAKPSLEGNLVTLGNQSSLRRLVLQGAPPPQEADAGRSRFENVVAVASRRRDDIVSATIDECELINNDASDVGPDGPTGGAILAYTRNPKQGEAPPPHVDAEVARALTRCIISTKGKAVFAMNFASRGKITIRLRKNDIGGPLDVIGGLSRPDAVVGATTTIISHGNHYSLPPATDAREAWQIVGGSSSPLGGNSNTNSNSASVESRDDQIKGFQVGIVAVGGRRLPGGGTCSNNKARLELLHMTVATNGTDAADFEFMGALSFVASEAGDGNIVHVLVQKTTGSGRRENVYANGDLGTRNRLVIVGSPAAFTRSNRNIIPAPPDGFFEYGG
jgi:hypothetical protein